MTMFTRRITQKSPRLGPLLSLAALSLGMAEGATWYSTSNNQGIDNPTRWDDAFGAGGTNPVTAMEVDNDDTWIIGSNHRMNRGNANNFFGTLQVDNDTGTNDGEFLNRGGSTFETIILNGGAINSFRSNTAGITATTVTVTANGGIIGAEDDPSRFTIGTLAGSSEILIQKRGNGAPTPTTVNDGRVIMEAGTDYSGFTGIFRVQSDTSTGGRGFFEFAEDITTASFGLQVDLGGSYTLQNNVSVTTLQLGPDLVAPGGGSGTDGAYLYADFSPEQQAYLEDQGGSLKVTAAGTISLPAVSQGEAQGIDETIASIPGIVPDAGGETPTLTIFYDTEDGGTNATPGAGGWDFSEDLGGTFGEFVANLTGLTNETTYFYRARVTNSAGTVWADASGTFTTSTVPDLLVTSQDGDLSSSSSWTGSPPVPISGTEDTKTWRILHTINRGADGENVIFGGQTIEIGDGDSDDGNLRLEAGNGTLTVRNVLLNQNGKIEQDNNNNTLVGDTLTFVGDGGLLSPDRVGGGGERMFLDFENYAGSGTVYVFGNNANGTPALNFQTTNAAPGTAMSGFTGMIFQDVLNGNGGALAWDFSVTEATFGITLADSSGDLPPGENNGGASDSPGTNGKMHLNDGIDVRVNQLRLLDDASDGTNVLDINLPNGTYTLDTGVNPTATDLTDVGGQDYSRFFTGGTGTVTVDSSGGATGSDFAGWITGFPGATGDPTFAGDPDGDGIGNGLENFFGTNPGVFSEGLSAGTLTTGGSTSLTFTHPQSEMPSNDISEATYVWSTDLQTYHTDGETVNGTTVTFSPAIDTPSTGTTTVTATITGPVPPQIFVNVSVSQTP